MFQHFGIARQQVFAVERLQKLRVDNNRRTLAKTADFVFQSAKVNARFTPHRSINH